MAQQSIPPSTKIGRNAPCPCGSGRKYKECCERADRERRLAEEARREQERREEERRRQELREQERRAAAPPAARSRETPAGRTSPPVFPDRPRDEWDDWYDRLAEAPALERLRLLREVADEGHPVKTLDDIDYCQAYMAARDALLPEQAEAVISFLEHLMVARPDVFATDAAWYTADAASILVTSGATERLRPFLEHVERNPHNDGDVVTDLLGYIRLAGLHEESLRLAVATCRDVEEEENDFFDFAVDERRAVAGHLLIQDHMAKGRTDLRRLRRDLCAVGVTIDGERLAQVVDHLSGAAAREWSARDFTGPRKRVDENLTLLLLDFVHWLSADRGLPSATACLLRPLVDRHLSGTHVRRKIRLSLDEGNLTEDLAHLLRLFPPDLTGAIGTVIGLAHFHDFLRERGLSDADEWRDARAGIAAARDRIAEDLASEAWRYEFAWKMWPDVGDERERPTAA